MAKYLQRIDARKLRERGLSVKAIAKELKLSKSTVSTWVRDVPLSKEQIQKLKNNALEGAERGRLKTIVLKREKRLKIIEDATKEGIFLLQRMTDREFLIAGLSLYWGEGGKSNKRVEFCNSDPKMIEFLLLWLQKCFDVQIENCVAVVGINQIHENREHVVKRYWSNIAKIPLQQFRKTSFKRVRNKKVYENFNEHFGTLTILVRRSTALHYKLMGLIEGLRMTFVKV